MPEQKRHREASRAARNRDYCEWESNCVGSSLLGLPFAVRLLAERLVERDSSRSAAHWTCTTRRVSPRRVFNADGAAATVAVRSRAGLTVRALQLVESLDVRRRARYRSASESVRRSWPRDARRAAFSPGDSGGGQARGDEGWRSDASLRSRGVTLEAQPIVVLVDNRVLYVVGSGRGRSSESNRGR